MDIDLTLDEGLMTDGGGAGDLLPGITEDVLGDEARRADAAGEISRATAENEAKMTETKRECEERISAVTSDCQERVTTAEGELSELREAHTIACAELLAQRQINGSAVTEGGEDFTERDRFEELEREYEALGKLLESEWKKTKKKIRRRVLWKK